MKPAGTLLLKRKEVSELLSLDECIASVEQAFRLYAQGKTLPLGILGIPARNGGFHIKAAGLTLGRNYFVVKTNGNFFQNRQRYGMANIQGVIALCDADNGYPLALMDSIEITISRTGAATAIAAKYLARADAHVATICGCGNQGRVQLRALTRVRRLERVYAYDIDACQAQQFAEELSAELCVPVQAVADPAKAVRQSNLCVTCTPSRRFFLRCDDLVPGTFLAAVGADSEDKQELEPALLASNKVITDIREQCATIGELHHAIEEGLLTCDSAYAELGEIVTGAKPGRISEDEIIIFDSTGTALEDAAAAALVYEKALRARRGLLFNLAE